MNGITPALELKNVARSYAEGKGRLDVFKDLNLTVRAGEIVALVGQSGSGKSSLLHIAGLLEAPTAGEVLDRRARTARSSTTRRAPASAASASASSTSSTICCRNSPPWRT